MLPQPAFCDALHESISLLAAGCLPPEDEAAIRAHLLGCQACAQRLSQFSAVCDRLSRGRPAATPTAEILHRWDALTKASLPEATFQRTRSLGLRLAAAIAVSLLVGAWWMSGSRAPPPPVEPVPPPLLVASELARAETDADFDEVLRHHYGAARFRASSGTRSRSHELLKEFLQ